MSDKYSRKYDEQAKKESDAMKQLALADAKKWFEKIPEDKREKPAIVVGTKVFTPKQLIKEVEDDTEYGRQFGEMLNKVRVELAKREAEK